MPGIGILPCRTLPPSASIFAAASSIDSTDIVILVAAAPSPRCMRAPSMPGCVSPVPASPRWVHSRCPCLLPLGSPGGGRGRRCWAASAVLSEAAQTGRVRDASRLALAGLLGGLREVPPGLAERPLHAVGQLAGRRQPLGLGDREVGGRSIPGEGGIGPLACSPGGVHPPSGSNPYDCLR